MNSTHMPEIYPKPMPWKHAAHVIKVVLSGSEASLDFTGVHGGSRLVFVFLLLVIFVFIFLPLIIEGAIIFPTAAFIEAFATYIAHDIKVEGGNQNHGETSGDEWQRGLDFLLGREGGPKRQTPTHPISYNKWPEAGVVQRSSRRRLWGGKRPEPSQDSGSAPEQNAPAPACEPRTQTLARDSGAR